MITEIRYRKEIDGFRAVAVGSVILNHFNSSLVPSGYLGVDIFFVISGYVISLSLCTHPFHSLREFLLGFYARRFKRIMPILILCVVVSAVFLSFVDIDPDQSLHTGFFALFGLSNLYLIRLSSEYFGSPSQINFFTQTWSLGVEEQFYLLFPLILWLGLRKPSKAGFTILSAGLAAIGAISLVLFVCIRADKPILSFYLMPLRFWELATGCLVALYQYKRGALIRISSEHIPNLVVLSIFMVLFFPPGLALLSNVLVVALTGISLAILSPRSFAYQFLASRPAIYLGLLSYSLYLWHWPILVLGRFTIGVNWWTAPILLGLTFLIANISYHIVEKPLRTLSWAGGNGATVLRGGGAALVAASFVAILAGPLEGHLYTGIPAQLAARNKESLSDRYKIPLTSYAWAGPNCILFTNADVGKKFSLDACTLGRFNHATRRVMVFGNSFAAAFVHGFDALVKDDNTAVTITSAWGATPIADLPNDTPLSNASTYYWKTVVPGMVSRLQPGDLVFLISDISYLAPEQNTPETTRNLELYQRGLRRFSAELAKAGVRLAVLDAIPFARDANCKPETALPQWFAPRGGPCTFFTKADTIIRRQAVDTVLRQLQHEHLLVVIDLIDVFCPGQICNYTGNRNEVLYRDEFSHPSVEAVCDAAPVLRRGLTTAIALN